MGLFSSKKKIYVRTHSQRMVKDELVPNSAREGIMQAILTDQDPIDVIQQNLASGINARADTAYRYGSSSHYTYGSTRSGFVFTTRATDEIIETLSTLAGQEIELVYSYVGILNFYHQASQWLQDTQTYDQETNRYTFTENGVERIVYPTFIQVRVPESFKEEFEPEQFKVFKDDRRYSSPSTQYQPKPYSPFINDPVYTHSLAVTSPTIELGIEEVKTKLVREYADDGSISLETHVEYILKSIYRIPYTVPNNHNTVDYYQVAYRLKGSKTVLYFTYQAGLGTYPLLDNALHQPPIKHVIGDFYPRGYFRLNGLDLRKHAREEDLTCSKRFFRRLGLKYDDLQEKIHENPDVGKVRQAFMQFATPLFPSSTNQEEKQYLYLFFKQLHEASAKLNLLGNIQPSHGAEETNTLNPKLQSFMIEDNVFTITLNIEDLKKYTEINQRGKVGEYFFTYSTEPYQGLTGVKHTLKYIKQISTHVCEVYSVSNLWLTYHIYDGHNTVASLQDRDNFLIPLDRSIVKKMSPIRREKLLARSMYLVFNSLEIVKLKWYQTKIFKTFLTVVSIALVIYGAWALYSAVSTAIATATAQGIVLSSTSILLTTLGILGKEMLIGMAISMGTRFVAKALGADLAGLIAVIATAVAGYGLFTGTTWASVVSQVSIGLAQGGQRVLASQMDKLQEVKEAFLSEVEKGKEKLSTVEKMLQKPIHLSPLHIWGETPEQFFNRTLNVKNPIKMAILMDLNFIKHSLTLPTIEQSLIAIENFQTT